MSRVVPDPGVSGSEGDMHARSARRYDLLKPYKSGTHRRPSFTQRNRVTLLNDSTASVAVPRLRGGTRKRGRVGERRRCRTEDGPRGHWMKTARRWHIRWTDLFFARAEVEHLATFAIGPGCGVVDGIGCASDESPVMAVARVARARITGSIALGWLARFDRFAVVVAGGRAGIRAAKRADAAGAEQARRQHEGCCK